MATEIETTLDPDKEYEIVDGVPEEKVMGGGRHSGAGTRLLLRLGAHAEAHGLGAVYGADASFTIGGNERIPDAAFVSAARFPPEGEPEGAWPIAPDLAVEVISRHDVYENVLAKVAEYFAGGVREVWLVSPRFETVAVHRSPTQATLFTADQELVSETLLPGFRCQVGALFRPPVPPPKPTVNG